MFGGTLILALSIYPDCQRARGRRDKPGFERSGSASSSKTGASTRRGSERRIVPGGVNLWRQLCDTKDEPLDDDDHDDEYSKYLLVEI